jgi:hypothetical protein
MEIAKIAGIAKFAMIEDEIVAQQQATLQSSILAILPMLAVLSNLPLIHAWRI